METTPSQNLINWFIDLPLEAKIRLYNLSELSEEGIEWINGEMLGDGNLSSRSKCSARFRYGSKYPEYIKYISDTLKSFGIEQVGKTIKQRNKKYGNISYFYQTKEYGKLLNIYKKWYPEGKKVVPRNIILTPITVRQWYIGDGCIYLPKEGIRPYIQLSTCAFSIFEVELLINKLCKLGIKANRKSYNNVIYISTHSTKDFLDYIGKCPVECYQYKFNYKMR